MHVHTFHSSLSLRFYTQVLRVDKSFNHVLLLVMRSIRRANDFTTEFRGAAQEETARLVLLSHV